VKVAQKVPTIADERRRLIAAQARRAELRVAREAGELVPTKAVELWWSAMIIEARTQLLAVPTRANQRLPHLSRADLAVLDGLIREALAGLAAGPKDAEPS
jgi:phage terminase Nu1 subunit (DNA packaging protein)